MGSSPIPTFPISLQLLLASLPLLLQLAHATLVPAFPGHYGYSALQNLTRFQQSILKAQIQRHPNGVRGAVGHARFDAFGPAVRCPDSEPLVTFGKAVEGRKLLCRFNPEAPLQVLSLGFGNNIQFETAVLSETNWLIDTFDCTKRLPKPLGDRQRFFKTCIGNTQPTRWSGWKMESYQSVVRNHKYTQVDILKMDIEGSELEVLMDWKLDDLYLPRQLSVELHYSDPPWFMHLSMKREGDMALLFAHLASLGYAPISREDNPDGPCCSEYTFLRVGVPSPPPALEKTGAESSSKTGGGWGAPLFG